MREELEMSAMFAYLLTFHRTVHYRSADQSVPEPRCLQSGPPSTESGVHSLGVGPLPGERRVSGLHRQAFREEEIQKQALI